MEKTTTSERLKQIMEERHLKQVDIQRMCAPFCAQFNVRIERNDLSQWVNKKHQPTQEKLSVLAMALDVSEAWLMGYDVPRERQTYVPEEQPPDAPPKTIEAKILAAGIDRMPEADRKRALEIVEMIFQQYQDYFERNEKEDES